MDLNDIPPYLATAFVLGAGCQLFINARHVGDSRTSSVRLLLVRFAAIALMAGTAAAWVARLLPLHSAPLPIVAEKMLIGTVPVAAPPLPIGEGPK